jgi:hypothetical protein
VLTKASLDVKALSQKISVLQQSRLAGAATCGDFVLRGALWASSPDFQGENPRCDL